MASSSRMGRLAESPSAVYSAAPPPAPVKRRPAGPGAAPVMASDSRASFRSSSVAVTSMVTVESPWAMVTMPPVADAAGATGSVARSLSSSISGAVML